MTAPGGAPGERKRSDDEPVLPEQTSDDVDTDWRDRDGFRDDDERYLRERPPHWE